MSNYKKKTDQELLLGYLRQQEAQEEYNSMSPKERREADKTQRATSRSERLDKARQRQRAADERTYGEDSPLLNIQPSAGENSRGGIWHLSTDSYEPVDGNQNGINDRINDSGIDRIASYDTKSSGGGGSGLPDFPGDDPDDFFSGVLVWDDASNSALWEKGEAQGPLDDGSYADIITYLPHPNEDKWQLQRYDRKTVILCENGEPVEGEILFVPTGD